MTGLDWTLNIRVATVWMLNIPMLVHQIQIAMVLMLVLVALDPLLYFVHFVKLTHLSTWILIVVWVLLAIDRRLSIAHAGCWRFMLSNRCDKIDLLPLLLVLDHNLWNRLERGLLRQLLVVLWFCYGLIRLYQPIPTAHHVLDGCLLFRICVRITSTFILIFLDLLNLTSIGNHSFSADLNPFADGRSFVNFALLKELSFCGHGLEYPWRNLLFTHVTRPTVIVDFNLLHTYAATGEYLRYLDLLMVVRVWRAVLSIEDFLEIGILTYSYSW